MYAGKVGRDHLGLGSVSSDQILRSLSPSINVLTYHPRYYSFYVFLLDEFWLRNRPGNESAWEKFYRPREFIFSVGAYLCQQPEHGDMDKIVGGRKTGPLALQTLPAYDTTTNYIESSLGGYGLYYRTVMAELELIYPAQPGVLPVDVPSEKGREVAAAFRRAVKDTVYYRRYFDLDETQVPIDVIREYIQRACLCQLQRLDAPERPLLLDVFSHGGSEANAMARRATFRLFLDIAGQTQQHVIDQDTFRQLVYFQASSNGATYHPQEAVLATYRRWRLYQAREYYAFALNALWYYLCDWGLLNQGDIRPLPLAQLWQHLNDALDFNALATWLNVPAPGLSQASGFQQLLDWLTGLIGANQASFDEACTLNSPIHEHRLYTLAGSNRAVPQVMVAGMITLLALIYLRFGRREVWQEPEWEISRMGADGRLSVHEFIQSLRHRLRSGPVTIGEITRWMYQDYIILQHRLMATSKLPDNTFRFQQEGNRLRFYNLNNSLEFMDSRFDALSTMVYELGLCGDLRRPEHPLTNDGRRLLHEGDLSWTT